MLDNLIVADVMIEMVYPSPECNFVLNVGSDFDMTCHSITNFKSPCLHNFYVFVQMEFTKRIIMCHNNSFEGNRSISLIANLNM